ncbi:PE family protein [Mycobacterium marinum]|uniref:PE family protein n=1 Tax=Mycobacterium marinum TaxID=1781 RepID=UPI0035674D8D
MPFVNVVPGVMASAAADMAGIGEVLDVANVAAAASTTGIVPAAVDEVSGLAASLLNGIAGNAVSAIGEAVTGIKQFANQLLQAAGSYVAEEQIAMRRLANFSDDPSPQFAAIHESFVQLLNADDPLGYVVDKVGDSLKDVEQASQIAMRRVASFSDDPSPQFAAIHESFVQLLNADDPLGYVADQVGDALKGVVEQVKPF